MEKEQTEQTADAGLIVSKSTRTGLAQVSLFSVIIINNLMFSWCGLHIYI